MLTVQKTLFVGDQNILDYTVQNVTISYDKIRSTLLCIYYFVMQA